MNHFPSKEDFDTSLVAFIESDFICILILVDFFVRSPYLDFSVLGGSSLKHVLSYIVFIIQRVEIGSFSLIGKFGIVVEHITIGMHPSVVVVPVNCSLFSVNEMSENSILASANFKIFQSFNIFALMIKTWSKNEGFVGVLSVIVKKYFVFVRFELSDLLINVDSRPWFNLGRDCA